MSKSHTWFGTKTDAEVIIAWLRDAGAQQLNGEPVGGEWEADGREFPLHFPSIGPVEFWPEKIPLPKLGDNSPRAKRTILARLRQQEHPGRPEIDVDHSAVAGLKLPEFRDSRYWVSGEVWFPTARLKDVFPELNRVCGRFERFLKTHPVVFDNTKGEEKSEFPRQICAGGVIHKIFALPEAHALLNKGEFMIDYMASPTRYADFRRRLKRLGLEK